MFPCRAAWQRFGPVARRAALRLPQGAVQRRSMSSVPGGSGENIVYIVLCGGAMVGALSYGYSTVTSDHARFNKRIEEIRARSNDEWSPKPWPPKSGDEETSGEVEVGAEEAAAGEVETVVEEAAEVVAEAAEVVVEAAQEVEAVAQEVEAGAQEVVKAAEVVEEAAKAVTEPPAVAVEEPESDVLLAAASTVEVPKIAEIKDELARTIEELKEDDIPALKEGKPMKDVLPLVLDIPATEKTITPGERVIQAPVPEVEEDLVPAEEASAVEVPAPKPVPVDVKESLTQADIPVEKVPTAVEVVPIVEETPAQVHVLPVVEEPTATEEVPVVEETPAVEVVPAVEKTPASLEVAPVVEETFAAEEVVLVVEETPAPVEVASVTEEGMALKEVGAVAEKFVPSIEETTAPVAEEVLASEEHDVATSLPEEPVTCTQVVASILEEADTATVETPAEDANKEYIVVILEGTPKKEKRPKVLGIGSLTGRIIPAPEDNSVTPSEAGRHRLRMQMQ
ncbi:calphotin isoform X2 [Kryptolebias marmoratus]|uniref:calphotin isoform X2 n=1 Tax=Kryptolebias marmoratus TaxID=37003 RepID=UPI0007F88C75|nr:calphotin isoform X2 [Kryptolebias marmoratus]